MQDSILKSIKKLIGISDEDTSFDLDLIIHINSVFVALNQIGVGPKNVFSIINDQSVWNDFINDETNINNVITYVYLKVRILFDPPSNSSVLSSIERLLTELEWRLSVSNSFVSKENELL